MSLFRSLRSAGAASALFFMVARGAWAAAPVPDADDLAIRNYPLDIAKLRSYAAASTALADDARKDPKLQAELDKMSDEPEGSLAELKLKLAHHPNVFAYYKKLGLTEDDTVELPLAAANAAAATDPESQGSLNDFVSPAQVAFAKQHAPELQRLLASDQDPDRD